jgi:hypothetical protein
MVPTAHYGQQLVITSFNAPTLLDNRQTFSG